MQLSNRTTSSKEILHRNSFTTEAQTQHITQNHDLASAATRALGIFELLEHVATHLDPCDTFVLRRVSKTWRNVLEQEYFISSFVLELEMPIGEHVYGKHPLRPPLLQSVHIFNLSNRLQNSSQRILRVCSLPCRSLFERLGGSPALEVGSWRKVPACHQATRKVQLQYFPTSTGRIIDVESSTRGITLGDLADVWLRVLARDSSIDQDYVDVGFEAIVNMDGEAMPLQQLVLKPMWREWQQEQVADETIQVN